MSVYARGPFVHFQCELFLISLTAPDECCPQIKKFKMKQTMETNPGYKVAVWGTKHNKNETLCKLILDLEVIHQAWDAVFHRQGKHQEESWNIMHSGVFLTSRCLIWSWNTVLNAWYYFSNKTISEEILQMHKWAVFHLISKHSLNIKFLWISLWIINEFFMSQLGWRGWARELDLKVP